MSCDSAVVPCNLLQGRKSCTSQLVNSGRVLLGVVHREEEESSKVRGRGGGGAANCLR